MNPIHFAGSTIFVSLLLTISSCSSVNGRSGYRSKSGDTRARNDFDNKALFEEKFEKMLELLSQEIEDRADGIKQDDSARGAGTTTPPGGTTETTTPQAPDATKPESSEGQSATTTKPSVVSSTAAATTESSSIGTTTKPSNIQSTSAASTAPPAPGATTEPSAAETTTEPSAAETTTVSSSGPAGSPAGSGSPVSVTSGQPYYIVSDFADGKVIEIDPDTSPLDGAKIRMWDQRTPASTKQQWVTNSEGFIVSAVDQTMGFADSSLAIRGVVFRAADGRLITERFGDLTGLEMHALTSGHIGGNWTWGPDQQIRNTVPYALTILNASPEDGALLIQHTTDPEEHKKWRMVPASGSPSSRRRHQQPPKPKPSTRRPRRK